MQLDEFRQKRKNVGLGLDIVVHGVNADSSLFEVQPDSVAGGASALHLASLPRIQGVDCAQRETLSGDEDEPSQLCDFVQFTFCLVKVGGASGVTYLRPDGCAYGAVGSNFVESRASHRS